MNTFKGRPVIGGSLTGEALVTKNGFNPLATFQRDVILRRKETRCGDQNNPDLAGRPITGKILVIPQAVGSTTGGLVLQEAVALGVHPAAIICALPCDTLTATGGILAKIWNGRRMVIVDGVGSEILHRVKTGDTLSISEDGTITQLCATPEEGSP